MEVMSLWVTLLVNLAIISFIIISEILKTIHSIFNIYALPFSNKVSSQILEFFAIYYWYFEDLVKNQINYGASL